MASNQNQGNNRGGNNRGNNGGGFQNMDENKQRQIASKGGQAVSQDREHMSEIGRKGGESSGGGNRGGGNNNNNR